MGLFYWFAFAWAFIFTLFAVPAMAMSLLEMARLALNEINKFILQKKRENKSF